MLKREVNETVQINNISAEKWTSHFKNLHAENANNRIGNYSREEYNITEQDTSDTSEVAPITVARVWSKMKKLKNGKASDPDNIPNELFKYAGESLAAQLSMLFNKIIQNTTTPEE